MMIRTAGRVLAALLGAMLLTNNGAAQPPNVDDLLKEARLRQLVEEQRVTAFVDTSVLQVTALSLISPEAARIFAKKVHEEVAGNPDLSEDCRSRLLERLKPLVKN